MELHTHHQSQCNNHKNNNEINKCNFYSALCFHFFVLAITTTVAAATRIDDRFFLFL